MPTSSICFLICRRRHRARPRWVRTVRIFLLTLALLPMLASQAMAHGSLTKATPGDGDRLTSVPRELRLTFNEAVELALSHLALVGPGGAVSLSPLTIAPDSAKVLVVGITGSLAPGLYTVNWQVAGPDGHPVQGQYTFTIESGAAGLPVAVVGPTAPGQVPPPAEHHEAATFPSAGGFDAESFLYVVVRWLTFMGLLGVIGAVAFRLVVLRVMIRRADPAGAGIVRVAAPRAAKIGLAAVALVAVALVLRLYAQSYAVHGATRALDPELISTLISRTTWGWGWILQALGTVIAFVGLRKAGRDSHAGWVAAAVGAVVLAFTPALSGHAASANVPFGLAILSDAVHVLGAGGWLGSLLLVTAVGIPAALKRTDGDRGKAVAALINAFSPTALAFAGAVVVTGVFAAWIQLGSVPALWQTGYGRTLLLKLAALSVVFGTGAYNWRKVKPALGHEVAAGRLRRSATLELAVGVVVVAITAVLVATATPKPSEMAHNPESSAHIVQP